MSNFVVSGVSAAIGAAAFYLLTRSQNKPVASTDAAASSSAAAVPSAASDSSASSSTPAEKAKRSRALRKELDKKKLKMVLLVRNDIGMGKGKMMAQCCHAAVGVVEELLESQPELVKSWNYNGAMKIGRWQDTLLLHAAINVAAVFIIVKRCALLVADCVFCFRDSFESEQRRGAGRARSESRCTETRKLSRCRRRSEQTTAK